jgi:hypothetical protein
MTLQTVPAVPSPPAGWKPSQADFDFWVGDSFSFLSQAPVFRAQREAAQSLTGGAYNTIALDTILEDPYSGWSATDYWWTCPDGCAGWYEATLTATAASQGTGAGIVTAPALFLNGSAWQWGAADWAPSGAVSGSSGTVQVPLVPGDYVQFAIVVSDSVSTPATAGEYPSMELAWVSS